MATKSHEKARAERAHKTLGKIEKLAAETLKQVTEAGGPDAGHGGERDPIGKLSGHFGFWILDFGFWILDLLAD